MVFVVVKSCHIEETYIDIDENSLILKLTQNRNYSAENICRLYILS